MAVAAYEQISYFNDQSGLAGFEGPELPRAIVVPDMANDGELIQRAEHFIHVADTAMRNEVKLTLVEEGEAEPQITSLKEAIHAAANGDEKGRKIVRANAATDVIERTIKVEHVMEVALDVDDDGKIHQHGHSSRDIQANSLRYASNHWAMRRRVEAETRNSFRLQASLDEGHLDDYVFVVISRAADDMSQPDMKKAGFFTDTMSASIQATTVKDGVLTTESAFVAGVKQPGEEQHDAETAVALGEQFGVDLAGKSATETIDMPLLIHKSLIPDGVIDLVKIWDDCAGGTFFGRSRPRQDYDSFRAECQAREETFEEKVEAIVGEVISRAASVQTEVQATRLLSKVSGRHMVDKAIEDPSIDPLVFGEESAAYITQSRRHYAMGNVELAEAAAKKARSTERSSSCPGEGKDDDKTDIYGFKVDEDAWHGGKKYHNKKCVSCKVVKREVGACLICEECVGKPNQRQKAAKAIVAAAA